MAFILKKRIEFDSFGDDWKGCYLEFVSPSLKQIKELGKSQKDDGMDSATIDFLKSLFVSGKGFDGKSIVEMSPDNIEELPIPILLMCDAELAGQLSPKVPEN